MAPRTKAQQIAYNAKRRAITAATKNPARTVVAPAKRQGQQVKLTAAKKRKAELAAGPAKLKAKLDMPKRSLGGRTYAEAAQDKRDAEIAKARLREPTEVRVNAKLKATAKALKAKMLPKVERLSLAGVTPRMEPKVEPTPTRSLGASAVMDGSPPMHTMARSYVRNGGAGRGKLRGKTYQTTVSFTQEQMNQVVAAAGFRNVSLAEMIRSCVVEHLNKGM